MRVGTSWKFLATSILLLAPVACGDSPATPTTPRGPDSPVDSLAVRVTGRLLAGSTGVTIAGASMRLLASLESPSQSVTTDDDGRFTLTGSVPRSVTHLAIGVTRTGWGSWTISTPLGNTENVTLRVPGLLLVGSGGTYQSELAPGPGQIPCTDEGVPCLRLVVDGRPGALIELELIPGNGQKVGLIRTNTSLPPATYPTSVVVLPTAMWVMGAPGPFTLKAIPVNSPTGPAHLVIRSGETLRGELGGPNQFACTFESVPCLRLDVLGPPGMWIDLELIPEDGQQLGLILSETFLAPTTLPTRMSVPPIKMWIMGAFGKFTLKASNAASAAQR